MPTDPETVFHIRQAFAELRGRPMGEPRKPPPLTRETLARDVHAAFADLDPRQLAITRRLSPAQRFQQVCELNDFLRKAVIAAIRQQHPQISEAELQRQFLFRMGIFLEQP